MSRKKLFSWIACLAVVVALSSCTTSQDIAKKQPILKLDSLAVDSVSLSDVVLRAGFSITNPYPLSIEITKGVIETFVEDRRLVYTVSENSFYVNAGKTEKATFLIRVKYEDMEKTIAHYTEKEELTLTVNALFEVSLPDIPTLPKRTLLTYSTAKVIPALKPVLTVSNFAFIWPTKESVAKALANAKKSPLAIVRILGIFAGKDDDQAANDLKDVDLMIGASLDVVIENKTKAKIEFRKMEYETSLNGVAFISGVSTDVKNEGSKSIMRLSNSLNSRALHRGLIAAMAASDRKIETKGKAEVKFPDKISEKTVVFNFGDKK